MKHRRPVIGSGVLAPLAYLLVAAVLGGCGSEPAAGPDPGVDTGTGDGGGSTDATADSDGDGCVVVTLPAAAQTSASVGQQVLVPELMTLQGDQVVAVQSAAQVDVVYSPDLPTEIAVSLGPLWYGQCGPLNGTLTITRAEVTAGTAVAFELTGSRSATLSVSGAGTASVELTGTYAAPADVDDPCARLIPAGGEIPFTEVLTVDVIEPTATRWYTGPLCGEPVRAAVGRRLEGLGLIALGPDGRDLYPINALPYRSVAFDAVACDLDGAPWAPWDEEGTSMLMPNSAGRVTLEPTVGDPMQIEVVDIGDVSTFATTFEIGGMAGGPTVLEDGGSYGPGWGRTSRYIFATVDSASVEQTPICTDVPPTWFTLSAEPPERCAPREPACSSGLACYLFYGQLVADAIYAVADGECTLELSAPEAAGGQGFVNRVTFWLTNVEGMMDPQ